MDKVKEVTSRFGHIWEDVTNIIIRPQRSSYTLERLGPKVFRISDFSSTVFQRTDFELENMRGMTIQCSWYKPQNALDEPRPCMIYLHGNCGSRIDALELMWVLRHGINLLTYDACGSGLSDGQYVSLGYYERQDLAAVCEYLRASKVVTALGLWGRSMGAVTAIMYASKDPSIACIVADSPFSSLGELTEELVTEHASWIPSFVANSAVRKVRKRVVKRAGFDFRDLNTLKFAAQCHVPMFLFHGKEDDFVNCEHSERISEVYGGSCLHRIVSGGHNSTRGAEVQSVAVPFIQLYMIDKVEALLDQARAALAAKAATESIAFDTSPPQQLSGTAQEGDEEEQARGSSDDDEGIMGDVDAGEVASPACREVDADEVASPACRDPEVCTGRPLMRSSSVEDELVEEVENEDQLAE